MWVTCLNELISPLFSRQKGHLYSKKSWPFPTQEHATNTLQPYERIISNRRTIILIFSREASPAIYKWPCQGDDKHLEPKWPFSGTPRHVFPMVMTETLRLQLVMERPWLLWSLSNRLSEIPQMFGVAETLTDMEGIKATKTGCFSDLQYETRKSTL